MATTFLTPSEIASKALFSLENQLIFGRNAYKEPNKEFSATIGDTVTIRKPPKFVATAGDAISLQSIVETGVPVVMNKRFHVAFDPTVVDFTLNIEDFNSQVIEPAIIPLANKIDSDLAQLYLDIPAASGVAGTTPAGINQIFDSAALMDQLSMPGKRVGVIDPLASAGINKGLAGSFDSTLVRGAVMKNKVGNKANIEFSMDQNVAFHTKGVATGTPLSNGATQVGASIITDGWTVSTAGILLKGDIITFAGVFAVNPVFPFNNTGRLKQFVVTADVASGATTGPATIPISPAIVTSGSGQNVTAGVPDNATIVVLADHRANLIYTPQTFALVMAKLKVPERGVVESKSISNNGFAISYVQDFDVNAFKQIVRLDVLYGVKTLYPETGLRMLG